MRLALSVARARSGIFLFSFLLGGQSSAQTFKIEFTELPQHTIEDRLRLVPLKNADRHDTLRKLFEAAGCRGPLLTEQGFAGKRAPNLICSLPGSTDEAIIIGAHYDRSVGLGEAVVDNWSGASLLPSLYESLRSRDREHTFVFIGFGGEEEGLIGSTSYVKSLSAEPASEIRAMVNLDCLGLTSPKVWASQADRRLLAALVAVARALRLPLQGINVDGVGRDDSIPFKQRKLPTISIHSITQRTLPTLHSGWDDLKSVKVDDYYATYRLIASYLAFLDSALEQIPRN